MQKAKNPLIFVVEDSLVYKDLIVGYLKSKKYQNIKTFKSGEECLKMIDLKPDLIVLDYSFEGINGLELMKKVKEDHPEIDFIFLSAQNEVEVAVKIMRMGAADYIIKNEKAPHNLLRSIEHMISVTREIKIRQGFKIGVIGFFIMLFVIIMVIILMTIFLEDFNL
ncbi:response regulator [Maribellus comscasis]|uniref:Response regulator n=1 Tax=Maribellus comscasis TaxID=2681766 RepID=A0A6I6JTM2_9BACT|nr:response regulator [Maribellus comscasis]QGY44438.1 response regulator [Maribellus comscasis]